MGGTNVTAAEQVSKRFSRRLRHRLIAGGPTSAGDDIPGWPALLASAEVLRERRVADRRSAALLAKAKARIPADAGSYHPDKVTHQLFQAMERLGAGYLARQLERLDCLAVMVSYLDHVVPLERPKPPSRRGKKKRSR